MWSTAIYPSATRLHKALYVSQFEQAVRVETDMPPPLSSPRDRPSASRATEQTQRPVVSHAQYVLTVTAAPASRMQLLR